MSFLVNGFSALHKAGIHLQKCNSISTAVRHFGRTSSNKKSSIFKIGLVGITMGALVGTGYTIHSNNKPRNHIPTELTYINTVKDIPEITPSRQIRYSPSKSDLRLTLYQYQTCPFCCKVRAFLDYYGISYDVVEVDPVLRQAIKWSEYKKVPILVADLGEVYQPLNDSSMIISAVSTYIKDGSKDFLDIIKCYPFITYDDEDGNKKTDILNKYFLMFSNVTNEDVDKSNDERKWRKWVDNVLVHTLSPNVYRTREEALQAFNWFSEVGEWEKNFPSWERYMIIYVGAFAMWLIGKRLKRRHRLKDDVRQSMYDECNKWARELKRKGTPFMGGDKPNLADLSAFGVLNSIEGCLAFQDLMSQSNIRTWYLSVKNAISNNLGASTSAT